MTLFFLSCHKGFSKKCATTTTCARSIFHLHWRALSEMARMERMTCFAGQSICAYLTLSFVSLQINLKQNL